MNYDVILLVLFLVWIRMQLAYIDAKTVMKIGTEAKIVLSKKAHEHTNWKYERMKNKLNINMFQHIHELSILLKRMSMEYN